MNSICQFELRTQTSLLTNNTHNIKKPIRETTNRIHTRIKAHSCYSHPSPTVKTTKTNRTNHEHNHTTKQTYKTPVQHTQKHSLLNLIPNKNKHILSYDQPNKICTTTNSKFSSRTRFKHAYVNTNVQGQNMIPCAASSNSECVHPLNSGGGRWILRNSRWILRNWRSLNKCVSWREWWRHPDPMCI